MVIKKKHSSTLWYRDFYDIVYSRAISTNFRRHCFQFNNHDNIGLRYRNQISCFWNNLHQVCSTSKD